MSKTAAISFIWQPIYYHKVEALTDEKAVHVILKPGKSNGALSERNRAERTTYVY